MRMPRWRRERSRGRQAVAEGRGGIGDTLAEMVQVALAIPAAAPDRLSQCSYYACRSKRALPLSVLTDIDPADCRAVQRAADTLWDALEHCPVAYDRVAEY